MGFFDRVGDIAEGVGGSLQAPFGFIADVAQSVNTEVGQSDLPFDDILKATLASLVDRGGQLFTSTGDPLIGSIPVGVRRDITGGAATAGRAVGGGVGTTFDALETAGREGIREPLATLMIAASIADSPQMGAEGGFLQRNIAGFTNLFDEQVWSDAHEMAQTTSIGQAVALAIGTRDILDEREVNNFAGTPGFQIASGTVDLAMRIFADVDVLIGGGAVDFVRALRGTGKAGFGGFSVVTAPQFQGSNRLTRRLAQRPVLDETGSMILDVAGKPVVEAALPNRILKSGFDKLPRPLRYLVGIDVHTAADVPRLQAVGIQDAAERARVALDRDIERFLTGPSGRKFLDRLPFFGSPQWQKWDTEVDNLIQAAKRVDDPEGDIPRAIALVRDRLLPSHSEGTILARSLVEAGSRANREEVMRIFLGDFSALRRLHQHNEVLGNQLLDMARERAVIKAQPRIADTIDHLEAGGPDLTDGFNILNSPDRLDDITKEIDAIVDLRTRDADLMRVHGALRQAPRLTVGGRVRTSIKNSTFYQSSPFAKPLRSFTDMRPHHLVHIDDPKADAQLARTLRQAGMDDEMIGRWRGRFMQANVDADRTRIFNQALIAAQRHIMKGLDLDDEAIELATRYANRKLSDVDQFLRTVKFDSQGRARIAINDDDAYVELPLSITEVKKMVLTPDFVGIRKEAERLARIRHGANFAKTRQATAHAVHKVSDSLDSMMRFWKTSVLFRPGWMFKVVVVDEQLRQMAKFGTLTVLLENRHRLRNYFAAIAGEPRVARMIGAKGGRPRLRGAISGAVAGTVMGGPPGTVAGATLGQDLLNRFAQLERAGYDSLSANGYKIPAMFGAPGENGEVFQVLNSSANSLEEAVGGIENSIMRGFRKRPGSFQTHHWGDSERLNEIYRQEWRNLIANRIRFDPMARMWFADEPAEAILEWLTLMPEGRVYASNIPGRRGREAEWVEDVIGRLEELTGGLPEVKRAIAALGENPQMNIRRGAKPDLFDLPPARLDDTGQPIIRVLDDAELGRSPWEMGFTAWTNEIERLRGIRDEGIKTLDSRLGPELSTQAQRAQTRIRELLPVGLRDDIDAAFDEDPLALYTELLQEAIRAGKTPSATAANDATRGLESTRTLDEIFDMIPEEARMPIHGQEIEQIMGGGSGIVDAIRSFVQTGMRALGTFPSDELSRNPTFARFYEAEMRRLVGAIPDSTTRVPQAQIDQWATQARRYALNETRDLLYDLAERSEFSEAVRILIPFFPAFQEVLTRWSALAVENPLFAARAAKAFTIPEKVGISYTDDQGNEFVQFRVPEFARDLIGHGWLGSALDSQGTVRFDKSSINLVAQGTPGFGPFAQVVVSEVVRDRPDLEDAFRFIIPFGPSDPIQAFMPATARRALALHEEDENRAFANARNRILVTHLLEIETGERPEVDFTDNLQREAFLANVESEARAFGSLRLTAAFLAPFAPIFDSPYAPYIDVYRAFRDRDFERVDALLANMDPDNPNDAQRIYENSGEDADAAFLDTFGEEYFAVTQAFTRSLNGVPPTVEAAMAAENFGDLITQYPEWGRVIIGDEGGGEVTKFSRAVYDAQLNTRIRAGADENVRERLSAEEIAEQPDIRLGWIKYSKAMDLIDSFRVAAGLPNLSVQAAQPLAFIKRIATTSIAQEHPSWFQEFQTQDRGRWDRVIAGARALSADTRLQGRPDIEGLGEYLNIRDGILAALTFRRAQDGSGSLDSTSNVDLAQLFATAVASLTERNPAFADLYYRRLENEPLAAPTPGPPEASAPEPPEETQVGS